MTERAPRRWWSLLAALTTFALAIRLLGLERRDLWYDEQVTLIDSQGVSVPAMTASSTTFSTATLRARAHVLAIARHSATHDQPLYVTLVHLWTRLFGRDESALRLPSALLGAAAVPLLARLGLDLVGQWPSFVAALLLTLSPLHHHYSQEARVYPAVIFLLLLTVWQGLRLNPASSRRAWFAFGVCAALVPGLHVLAAAALLPLAVCLWKRDRIHRRLAWSLAGAALTVALLVPLGFLDSWITAHRESGLGFQAASAEPNSWARPSSAFNVAAGVGATLTRLMGVEYFPTGVRGRHVAALSLVLLIWVVPSVGRCGSKEARIILLGGAFIPLGVSAALSVWYGHTVPLQDRYSAWAIPFIALIFGQAAGQPLSRGHRVGLSAAVAVATGAFLLGAQLVDIPRETIRADEAAVLSHCLDRQRGLQLQDPQLAAVLAAWTEEPVLIVLGDAPSSGPGATWRLREGRVCTENLPPACAARWRPCLEAP